MAKLAEQAEAALEQEEEEEEEEEKVEFYDVCNNYNKAHH